MKPVILIGGFHEMLELCNRSGWTVRGIVDNSLQGEYRGVPVLGTDEDRTQIFRALPGIPMVLTPDQPSIRQRLAVLYESDGWRPATIVSPRAMVSESAEVSGGCVVQDGVNLSASVRIGNYVRLNTLANLMHDAVIGAFATIAPNAVVLGGVNIGEGAYVGASAVILPGIRVGARAVIGAGAVVTRDVPESTTVAGNPARELRRGP